VSLLEWGRSQALLSVIVSLRQLTEITRPLNTLSSLSTPQKQIQNSCILKYKLDNCASDFRDVGVRGEKEQTEREGREKEDRRGLAEQRMMTRGGKENFKREVRGWGRGGNGGRESKR